MSTNNTLYPQQLIILGVILLTYIKKKDVTQPLYIDDFL
jgi:hypothetical protein